MTELEKVNRRSASIGKDSNCVGTLLYLIGERETDSCIDPLEPSEIEPFINLLNSEYKETNEPKILDLTCWYDLKAADNFRDIPLHVGLIVGFDDIGSPIVRQRFLRKPLEDLPANQVMAEYVKWGRQIGLKYYTQKCLANDGERK
ncbi:hypothetical protein KY342_00490 [Candidatus Woesearchaeota archaeon]|nr:hypothetical protein [Candidatus Woesearchaeota archaeon]